ncbi:MAG: hypothetical protein HY983_01230 [Candidatus Magasanikbacteria bacterium]|nr:hypothetical protein [Candidatus Magasanikbacteria bacterium]
MRFSLPKSLLIIAALYPLVVFPFFPKWAVDDAYISYRYADNLARQGQLTWNVGEEPVDGNTGLAWPIILAGFIGLGVSPITASHSLGIASFFFGGVMLWLLLRRLNVLPLSSALTVFFYATVPLLFTHALSGMETVFFVATFLAALYLLALVLTAPTRCSRSIIFFLLTLLLLGFIRPEGVVVSAFSLFAVGYYIWRSDRAYFGRFCVTAFLVYVLPMVGAAYWQWRYYGFVLPNTYYVKTITGFTVAYLADFFRFFLRFFLAPMAAALIIVLVDFDMICAGVKRRWAGISWRPVTLVAGVIVAFFLVNLAQFLRSHLSVNFSYRFYMPLLVIFFILFGIFLGIGLQALGQSRTTQPLRYRAVVLVVVILIGYQFLYYVKKLPEEVSFANDQIILQESEHNLIGRTLRQIVPPTEWLVVYMDAGAMPYFSGLKTLDFGALNDKRLAREHLTPTERVDYLFSVNPGVIVFSSTQSDRLEYGAEAEAIIHDSRFQNYTLYKVYTTGVPSIEYNEFVYLRKDLTKKNI